MFKVIVKQFKNNWHIFLATFLALFLSSILLASFSLLLINSIYAIVLDTNSGIKNPVAPIAIFGTLIGITFFIAIFSIYASINLSVKLRWQQFVLLRILGSTHTKIKLIVFCENLLISIFTVTISLLLAIPLSNGIINFLKNGGGLEEGFHLYKNFQYQWIYVLATIAIVVIITFFATLQIKKIEISNIDNFYIKKQWYKVMFQIAFGIVFLAGAIVLTVIHPIMIDGMGQGMIGCAIFCYIISLSLLGKYVVTGLLYFFQLIFKHYFIKTTLKSISANIERIFYPIILIISLILFVNYAITIPNLIKTPQDNQNQVISLLVAIIITVFNSIIAYNAIFQYFLEKKSTYKTLRILGYCKKQIIFAFFIENLFIMSIAFCLSFFPTIYFNFQFSYHNGLGMKYNSSELLFWLTNGLIFTGIIIFSMIPAIVVLKRL